jgi:two-component system phosphate regulon sensor histidine kinase PhoR
MAQFDAALLKFITGDGAVGKAKPVTRADLPGGILGNEPEGAIALPLIARQTLYGMLWVGYRQAHTFTASENVFLSIAAGQTAVAIANAHAFDAARQRREQLAAILTSSVDPILVIDNQEAIVLLNPAAEKVFDVNADDVVGKHVDAVIVDAQPLTDLIKGTTDTAEGIEWQSTTSQAFAPRVSVILNERNERTGRVLILRDITRYKVLRENQTEFVSTVSHDLRSPLTYMNGYADMLPLVGELNDRQKGFAEKISSGIAHMTDLVDKILDASRLDPEGHYQLNREPCDIGKIVNDVASAHLQPAEKKGLALTVELTPNLPVLSVDEVMVKRALNNLTDNAIKYTPENGKITIVAGLEGNNLLLCVRDTGLGISQENQQHLFERFRRVRRREHQGVRGSGLGLYIVKRVAERHGGSAWVESEEGKGSTFIISIPLEGPNLSGGAKS